MNISFSTWNWDCLTLKFSVLGSWKKELLNDDNNDDNADFQQSLMTAEVCRFSIDWLGK